MISLNFIRLLRVIITTRNNRMNFRLRDDQLMVEKTNRKFVEVTIQVKSHLYADNHKLAEG